MLFFMFLITVARVFLFEITRFDALLENLNFLGQLGDFSTLTCFDLSYFYKFN